jgi:hypothetical protein
MLARFRPLSVAMVVFFGIALSWMNAPVWGQESAGAVPAATSPQHVVVSPRLPAAQPPFRPRVAAALMAPLAEKFATVKDQLVRWIREAAVKILSGNETNLLSGNSPKLLSDNEPKILSGNRAKLLSENEPKILSNNKTAVLSGNKTPILSGNRISFFSGLKIEIHIENTGNNSGNRNLPPPQPAK